MALSSNITATYRGPGKVIARLLRDGVREDRALAVLMGACLIMFIAQWPRLAREAHLNGSELAQDVAGAFLAIVLFLPLILYFLGFVTHWIARGLGGGGGPFASRLALFWALFAASPIALLNGLVAGFLGKGLQLDSVGLIWLLVFLWFWIAGLLAAHRTGPKGAQ